jgi:hypothetical protein
MLPKTLTIKGWMHRCILVVLLTAIGAVWMSDERAAAGAGLDREVKVTANFTGRVLRPTDRIVFTFDTAEPLTKGQLAVLIGPTDMTSLFVIDATQALYVPNRFPLPEGETAVVVYLMEPNGDWLKLDEFLLKVESEPANGSPADADSTEATSASVGDRTNLQFTPNVAVNIKGQNQTLTFPRESAPERNPYSEIDGQIGLEMKVSRRGWTLANKFDFVGVGFRPNALRFGELQNDAPMIDLSSYLIEFGKGKFKVNFGHVSFGSNRHLINSFSSRGISGVVPIGKQNEITFAAMNGTSVVGYDNFFGVSRRKHSVIGVGFAREFFKERPNGLRVEFTVMRGSLLPLTNVNQGNVTDAERSLGFGFRVRGSDTKERLRYEAGISQSRFINPADPLLEQGQNVTAIRETWRTSQFAEISFDIVRGISLWNGKKLKLTGTYRHEEIEPLYRSIGVSVQADKRQHQFEFSGNFGEMNFAFGNLRDRDNLNDIASILKTLNRRNNVVIGIPLGAFFTPTKPNKWLPAISYTADLTHQFGAFLPSDGEFRDLSQVPDQKSYAQAFSAQWTLSDKLGAGYRYSRAFQDNRQLGRERADFRSETHGFSIGTKPYKDLDLDFEVASEAQQNLEQPRTDKTFRFGTRTTWRTAFLKNSSFSGGLSFSFAGDTQNQNDARNAELDLQWAYRFAFGKKKFKKLDAQFFIRYANRYGSTIERIFFVNTLNKTQAFNFGLSLNIL